MTGAKGQMVMLGVTGAGGAILAQKALELLVADTRAARVYLVVTATGQRLLAQELGIPSANVLSEDLVGRAADVMLKEGRKLVLCVRDTPFSRVHLKNMLRAQQAGAVIMPVIPAFYHQPRTVDDLVRQYACRVLKQIGLPQEKMYRRTGTQQREAQA